MVFGARVETFWLVCGLVTTLDTSHRGPDDGVQSLRAK